MDNEQQAIRCTCSRPVQCDRAHGFIPEYTEPVISPERLALYRQLDEAWLRVDMTQSDWFSQQASKDATAIFRKLCAPYNEYSQ